MELSKVIQVVAMVMAACLTCHAQYDRSDEDMGAFERILAVYQDAKDFGPPTNEQMFEGDIKLTEAQRKSIRAQIRGRELGNQGAEAVSPLETHRWPKGIVPYTIDCSLQALPAAKAAVRAAMAEWEAKTCLRFVERTTEEDYVEFYRGRYCQAQVGRIGGKQQVSVGYGCEYTHVNVHEIGHAIGFWHEQSRPDRDDWIEVLWPNVDPALREQFEKYSKDDVTSLGEQYDYGSIMHYPFNAFSSNGRDTIRPLRTVQNQPYIELSESDARQVQLMYDSCRDRTDEDLPTPDPKSACDDMHESCPRWADAGECENNKNWMLYNCKTSCSTCDGPCLDTHVQCPQWALQGECEENAEWMLLNCRLSCETCNFENVLAELSALTMPVEAMPPPGDGGMSQDELAGLRSGLVSKMEKYLQSYRVVNNACIRGHNQLGTFRNTSLRKCIKRCDADDTCKSFDHVPSERHCSLSLDNRDSAPDAFKACDPGWKRITTYYEKKPTEPEEGSEEEPESVMDGFIVISDTCLKGRSQLAMGNYYDVSVERCAERCAESSRCRSFNYVPPYRSCHLSMDTRATAVDECLEEYSVISDFYEKKPEVDFLLIKGACILGKNQLGSFYGQTVEECQLRCGQNERCLSFDYVNSYRSCHLSTDNRQSARTAFDSCPAWFRPQSDYYERIVDGTEPVTEAPIPPTPPVPTTTTTTTAATTTTEATTTAVPPTTARRVTEAPTTGPPGTSPPPRPTPPPGCSTPLGLGKDSGYSLPDASLSASSSLDYGTWSVGPENARLHFEDDYQRQRVGGWCAASSDAGEYLQIDLGRTKLITGVATQGRDKYFEHVKSYTLAYSQDGRRWREYEEGGREKVFEGNCDHVSVVTNQLPTPVTARYLRIVIGDSNYPCMRAEVYGCDPSASDPDEEPPTEGDNPGDENNPGDDGDDEYDYYDDSDPVIP